ncbi:MAG: class I SAM-dependent methyltransferase [Bacteriovoracaceae bacterium]|nr:class I SAM-dependent methyltransferase [Bacteriovoracaceae bacterium]
MMKSNFLGMIQHLHPASLKYLSLGHPWITKDRFSTQFPKTPLLYWRDSKSKKIFIFIHDIHHPRVCARLLVMLSEEDLLIDTNFNEEWLEKHLTKILGQSVERRLNLSSLQKRNHYYLAFQEADGLPGANLLKLGSEILFVIHGSFWSLPKFKKILLTAYQKMASKYDLPTELGNLWFQSREIDPGKQANDLRWPECLGRPAGELSKKERKEIIISETGVNFSCYLGNDYDYGIYTDMAAIRHQLQEKVWWKDSRVLNLFSYSGAFSILPFTWGAREVTSIDNYQKSWQLLEKNLTINPELHIRHRSLKVDIFQGLQDLLKKEETQESFDVIIVDPPPSFTSQKSKISVEDFYAKSLPLYLKLLAPKGHLLLFCNKHQVTWPKFKSIIEAGLPQKEGKITEKFHLTDDCPTIKGFSEGDYLKGFLFTKK